MRLAGGSEEEGGPPKLLSLREETPELALPDKVELLPSRMDCGLVGEAGIGCRGDWRESRRVVTVSRDSWFVHWQICEQQHFEHLSL